MVLTTAITADPLEIAGLAVAVGTSAVTFVLWLRGRQQRAIGYRISTSTLVSVRQEARDQITVLYAGDPVRDVRLLSARISCTGNVPVEASDFARPLEILVGDAARILSAECVRAVPRDLDPTLNVTKTRITIDPLLLNPGDSLEITAFVSNLTDDVSLIGRVNGVRAFDALTESPTARQRITRWAYVATLLCAAALGVIGTSFLSGHSTPPDLNVKLLARGVQ
jgi:hypothetical protein